jgi:tRNA A37 methylthiotransferase MiaB
MESPSTVATIGREATVEEATATPAADTVAEQIRITDLHKVRPMVDFGVWLADLTYTQQSIASEIMPQAIGAIASYAAQEIDLRYPIRLFKYPEALAAAFREGPPPAVIGLSHYIWNANLSLAVAQRIKEHFPDVAVVFGGPHYPIEPKEQAAFLRKLAPAVDFYVDREGERAFADLLVALAAAKGEVKAVHGQVPGVHSFGTDGTVHIPTLGPRLVSLTEIPSPYVTGLMDEFFDGRLIPTIQTNRGCPFSCSFCVEGTRYYSKVAKRTVERVREEILYIGRLMAPLIEDEHTRNELLITDSNFGMYLQDSEICDAIVEAQDTYGWPRYVDLTTGKNKRDRVLNAISRTRGTMTLSGSVQSLNADVLKAVRRTNIDAGQLMDVALAAAERQTGTYSEVILGLPEDSRSAHLSTLAQLIDAGFDRLNMFQLALLPGSEMWTGDYRTKFQMTTRFRVIPRCYGTYEFLDTIVSAVETDEICVSLPSLTFEDYVDCRRMNLVVAACYNDATFEAIVKLLRHYGLSVFSWLVLIDTLPAGQTLSRVLREFRTETRDQLWGSREDLEAYARANVGRYIRGELGNNLLYTYRVRMLSEALDDVVVLVKRAAKQLCAAVPSVEHGLLDAFIEEAGEYHRLRLSGLFTSGAERPRQQPARFDIDRFISEPGDVVDFLLTRPAAREYYLAPVQVATIEAYLRQYGATSWGAGRMLTKIRFNDLYRHVRLLPQASTDGSVGSPVGG